jgi:hypothetical protein
MQRNALSIVISGLVAMASFTPLAAQQATSVHGKGRTVAGTWASEFIQPPGAGYEMTLAQAGATVTGNGTYQREAGRPGTFGVNGNLRGRSLSLDMTFDDSSKAKYDGTVRSSTKLAGRITRGSGPAARLNFTKRAAPTIVLGNWGGEGVSLKATKSRAIVEFDCAHGRVSKPLRLDASGHFNARGVYVQEHSVEQQGQKPPSHPADYAGSVSGDQVSLTVTLADTHEAKGTFELTKGRAPHIVKCR